MQTLLDEVKNGTAKLENKYAEKIEKNLTLDRRLVSFQANKKLASYRWFKYKEGFSADLIYQILKDLNITRGKVIDPFAGTGTTLFVARDMGLDSTGIELLPVGCEIIKTRKAILEADRKDLIHSLQIWKETRPWENHEPAIPVPQLRITSGAYSTQAEDLISRFVTAISAEDSSTAKVLKFALLCVLEDISFTRKDGQYLRWDQRALRNIKTDFNKGEIPSFNKAITKKLAEIINDLDNNFGDLFPNFSDSPTKGKINLIQGSCLETLPKFDDNEFDCLVTSPPYCNRYDYTRTYALELALLGVDEEEIKRLRQTMLSCTVENKEKSHLNFFYNKKYYTKMQQAFESQKTLNSILSYLDDCNDKNLLNNSGIVRMIKNYFWEMTIWVFECARILKPNAPLMMVNDNVRYHGVTIPVDTILSDLAQKAGFKIEKIWVLPQAKGNSSQQMGSHGREELRKCVYFWRAP